MHLHYAHAAAEGGTEVRIEAPENIETFRIHPLRKALQGKVQGRALTFGTGGDEPRYFIVRINRLPPLVVIIEDPERDRLFQPSERGQVVSGGAEGDRFNSGEVIDAGAFLSDRTGVEDQTQGLQRALAQAAGSGGTLHVPPGTYAVTQLHLKGCRGFRLHLAPGCLIKIKPSARGENEHRHGLWLEDCEDVSVTGGGCIDHPGLPRAPMSSGETTTRTGWWTITRMQGPARGSRSPLCFITGSRRIPRVDGLTIRNGRNFNVNCRNSDDLTLRRLKILTPPACTPEYADGINTGSCQNVLIEDCLVASNDDCFASGHYFSSYDSRPSRNHVVRRVLGWSLRGSGARLGFYANQDQGDFLFEDCDFAAMCYTSFLIHPLREGPDGKVSRYGTIRAVNCGFDDAPLLESLLDAQKPVIGKLELVNIAFHGEPKAGAAVIVEERSGPTDRGIEAGEYQRETAGL